MGKGLLPVWTVFSEFWCQVYGGQVSGVIGRAGVSVTLVVLSALVSVSKMLVLLLVGIWLQLVLRVFLRLSPD